MKKFKELVKDLQEIIQKLDAKGVSVEFISERLKFGSNTNDAFATLQLQMLRLLRH